MRWNTQSMVCAALIVSVVASALALVSVRQFNRLSFYTAQKLERERDDLAIEWRQLMAEYSTWRLAHNVESEVRGRYEMLPPTSGNIQTIRLASNGEARSE